MPLCLFNGIRTHRWPAGPCFIIISSISFFLVLASISDSHHFFYFHYRNLPPMDLSQFIMDVAQNPVRDLWNFNLLLFFLSEISSGKFSTPLKTGWDRIIVTIGKIKVCWPGREGILEYSKHYFSSLFLFLSLLFFPLFIWSLLFTHYSTTRSRRDCQILSLISGWPYNRYYEN